MVISMMDWEPQSQPRSYCFDNVMQVMDSLSHPALLLVDGVSSIGALDFRFDEWKVDMAVTGSQKALSLPTGLAVVAASQKVITLRHTCLVTNLFQFYNLSASILGDCWAW